MFKDDEMISKNTGIKRKWGAQNLNTMKMVQDKYYQMRRKLDKDKTEDFNLEAA